MEIKLFESCATCDPFKRPLTVASMNSSNNTNDTVSSGESITTASPPRTPPLSPSTYSTHIIINGSELELQDSEEGLDKPDDVDVAPNLPTRLDAVRQFLPLGHHLDDRAQLGTLHCNTVSAPDEDKPDRCHQIAHLLASPTHPRVVCLTYSGPRTKLKQQQRIPNVSTPEYCTILSLGAESKLYQPRSRHVLVWSYSQSYPQTPQILLLGETTRICHHESL
jgi:hypothetical protein